MKSWRGTAHFESELFRDSSVRFPTVLIPDLLSEHRFEDIAIDLLEPRFCGIWLATYRGSSLRQPMTHPPGGPSKIAAGTSASRLSPTEAEVRTACFWVWRY